MGEVIPRGIEAWAPVDPDVIEYFKTRDELRSYRHKMRALQERILVRCGWELLKPNTKRWSKFMRFWYNRRERTYTFEWMVENELKKDRLLLVFETKDVRECQIRFSFTSVWTQHQNRMLRSCRAVATAGKVV